MTLKIQRKRCIRICESNFFDFTPHINAPYSAWQQLSSSAWLEIQRNRKLFEGAPDQLTTCHMIENYTQDIKGDRSSFICFSCSVLKLFMSGGSKRGPICFAPKLCQVISSFWALRVFALHHTYIIKAYWIQKAYLDFGSYLIFSCITWQSWPLRKCLCWKKSTSFQVEAGNLLVFPPPGNNDYDKGSKNSF